MPKLKWISDEDLYKAVSGLLDKAKGAKQKSIENFGANVIDPFGALFEMSGFGINYIDWVKTEEARQAQKTLQNFIGEFHQAILGLCNKWEDMGTGHIVDLVNSESKIIAEIKNKYNTISGGKLANLYWELEDAVTKKTSIYKGYTAYYVSIIPPSPKPFNIEFTPSDKQKGQKCPSNKLIRFIDGASFYTLVTGEENALENLFDVTPEVISEITGIVISNGQDLKQLFHKAYTDTKKGK